MRKARALNVVPGLPHHVVLRGNNRRRLCSYPADYGQLIFLLARATDKHAVAVHALCILSNHVHLIVTPPTTTALSSWVRGFAQPYAQRRNARLGASGKLFEERFFAKPIGTDAQLLATVGYVDANAVMAGVADTPADYPWCSYAHYAGRGRSKTPAALLTPLPWYEGLGAGARERSDEYARFVSEYLAHAQAVRTSTDAPLPGGDDGGAEGRAAAAPAPRRPGGIRCA
jgi:putative transposase